MSDNLLMSALEEEESTKIVSSSVTVALDSYPHVSITDEGWRTIFPDHLKCWKDAARHLGSITIDHAGVRFSLAVDWSPVPKRIRHHMSVLRSIETARSVQDSLNFERLVRKFVRSPTLIAVQIESMEQKEWSRKHVVEWFLHDFFLSMNLSCPGCCDFYSARFRSSRKNDREALHLSSNLFENSRLRDLEGRGPPIQYIPLIEVQNWLAQVRTPLAMTPKNRMEKVLFAILHICKLETSPASVIWLFYALEALFDTRVGENFSSLVRRIELLIPWTATKNRQFRRDMRTLYDLRSAFVHGGLQVVHPMNNEQLDGSVEPAFTKLMYSVDFGFHVVVTSVQEIIKRGWREPIFEEILKGQACDFAETH